MREFYILRLFLGRLFHEQRYKSFTHSTLPFLEENSDF